MSGKLLIWPALALCLMANNAATAATMTLGSNADSYVRDATDRGAFTFVDNRGFAGADFVGYFRFDMSALNIDSISSATLSLHRIAGSRNDAISNARFEVQGLLNVAGNTPQNWIETGAGALSTATVGLEYNIAQPNSVDLARVVNLDADDGASVTETTAASPIPTTLVGPDLISFLNARADDGGLVTFVVSVNANNDRGYGFASKENADANIRPTLTLEYTEVPEPASAALALVALVAVGVAARRKG
jgi:hypothetical protein